MIVRVVSVSSCPVSFSSRIAWTLYRFQVNVCSSNPKIIPPIKPEFVLFDSREPFLHRNRLSCPPRRKLFPVAFSTHGSFRANCLRASGGRSFRNRPQNRLTKCAFGHPIIPENSDDIKPTVTRNIAVFGTQSSPLNYLALALAVHLNQTGFLPPRTFSAPA